MDHETVRQPRTTGPIPRNTAVFIDMENLFGGYAGEVRGVPVAQIITEIRRVGAQLGVVSEIAVMRAYANWADGRLGVYRREMMEVGIEPIQVFGFGSQVKNAADIELVVDALATVYESPSIDVVVIVSGDGGFVPLVRHLHALGRYVILISVSAAQPPNKLLRAVVDHCHLIGEDRSVDPPPSRPTGSTPAAAVAEDSARELIRAAVRAEPDLVKDGVINGALLGNRVRELDPGFTLAGTGFKSFTALAVAALDLRPVDEQAPPATGPPDAAFPVVEVTSPTSRAELRSTVLRVTAADGFGDWFERVASDGAIPVQRLLAELGGTCPDFPASLKRLFPSAKLALRYALAGSGYALTGEEANPSALLVVPEEQGTLAPLGEADLTSERVIRDALARCTPPLRIPDTILFGDTLDAVLRSVSRPTPFSDIVEHCADVLEEWPADKVRVSLVALVTLGVLAHSESTADLPFEDRELLLSDAATDVDAALDLVSRGVAARLEPYSWPSTSALVDTIAVEHTASAVAGR